MKPTTKLKLVICFNKKPMLLANQRSDETKVEFEALVYGYVIGLGNGWTFQVYTPEDSGLPNIDFYELEN